MIEREGEGELGTLSAALLRGVMAIFLEPLAPTAAVRERGRESQPQMASLPLSLQAKKHSGKLFL
jgi:hypothetical protein